MKKKREKKWLSEINKIYTSRSGTTKFINYSYTLHVLEVKFEGGKIYHYRDVDPILWEEYKSIVQSGGSSGVFINTRIKPFYDAEEI